MSHELHYTSAPKGLKPGSKGFCTVACTSGIPVVLADRLENLSGYRQVYPPHDPNAGRNPAVRSHLLFVQGGQTLSILSRVGFAGLDYTDRSNKYAHHVVLGPDERPEGGPAWLASRPGFLGDSWVGEPRTIGQGRKPPQGDRPAGRCGRWQQQTGDAGWAGVLAETFLNEPRKVAYLIVPIDLDPLPLLEEALALVPPDRRWDVTFSTYFTGLPPGMACAWRCVLDGSPEATQCRRVPDAVVLDLTGPLGMAQGGPIVEQARTGIAPPSPRIRPETPANQPRRDDQPLADREPIGQGSGAIPDMPPPMPAVEKARLGGRRGVGKPRRPPSMTYQFAGILAASAALMVGVVWLVQHFLRDSGGKPRIQVARNDHDPARNPPQDDPPPQPPPKADPKPADPPPIPDPAKAGREATVWPPEPEKKATPTPPPPGPGPEPVQDGPKVKVADGPRPLKFWGLPRRAGSQVGGSGRDASNATQYKAAGPIRSLRLIGMDDEPIKAQRLAARPDDASQALKVVRSEGPGSTLVSGNDEVLIGTFRWEGNAIAFDLASGIRDPAILTAFFDCLLEVQPDGGPTEYVYLTDPDSLARESLGAEPGGAMGLPDAIHWPRNRERPDEIRFDRAGIFGRSRQASLNKSNRSLVLIACRLQPYQPGPPPWNEAVDLIPDGRKNGKLLVPGKKEPRIAALIDGRSGELRFEFSPPPPEVEREIGQLEKRRADLYAQAQSLNKMAKTRLLTEDEQKKGMGLEKEVGEVEQDLEKKLAINTFSNQALASGIEITVGIEAGGELFVLPTIRSPRLANASASGGR